MSIAIPSTEIWHRGDFPTLATWRKYERVIEVGVDRGEFAQCFLSRWINGRIYLGVDSYQPYDEMPFNRDGDFHMAVNRLTPYGAIAKLLREDSIKVAETLLGDLGKHYYSLPYQFIYIDGAHNYESVLADLKAWWPIVSEDGMLAGHDWSDPRGDNQGVQQAVREFAASINRPVYYTLETTEPTSWYIYKTLSPSNWKRC